MKKNIGVYLRVNKNDDVDLNEKYGIINSILKDNNFLNDKYEIKYYEDFGCSGLDNNRTELNNLLLDIENKKIDIIVTPKISTLTRDSLFLNFKLIPTFYDFNIDLVTINGKEKFYDYELFNESLKEIMIEKYGDFENEM